jgi:hypothetical protein
MCLSLCWSFYPLCSYQRDFNGQQKTVKAKTILVFSHLYPSLIYIKPASRGQIDAMEWKHPFSRDSYIFFMDGSCHGVSSVRPRSTHPLGGNPFRCGRCGGHSAPPILPLKRICQNHGKKDASSWNFSSVIFLC